MEIHARIKDARAISPFKSKSEEKRHKTLRDADPKGLSAIIEVFPIKDSTANGVAVRLDGVPLKSKLCCSKADILKFLDEVL